MPHLDDLKYISENINKMAIGLDDTFEFSCRRCGNCCRNRDDIILTSKDVYNIAKDLSRTPYEVIKGYCETYIGPSSGIPVARLKPRGDMSCPLLFKNDCILHKAKPGICAIYPIGRYVLRENTDDIQPGDILEAGYLKMPVKCGKKHTITVRDWLGKFGIPVNDTFFSLWHTTLVYLGSYFAKMVKQNTSGTLLNDLYEAVANVLYVNYDTSKEFFPQFEKGVSELKIVLENISNVYIPGHKDDANNSA